MIPWLWNPLKARENFQGENNKRFDLTLFRKETIRIVFDALHGIVNEKARSENFIMKQWENSCSSLGIPQEFWTEQIIFHPWDSVKLSETLEILAYCLFDGKVDQKSEFETELYHNLVRDLQDECLEFGFYNLKNLFDSVHVLTGKGDFFKLRLYSMHTYIFIRDKNQF